MLFQYFEDGTKKAVSVQSAALSVANLFAYSYRADGIMQSLRAATTSAGTQAITWTYTPAGRLLTQSDPFSGQTVNLYGAGTPTGGGTSTLVAKSVGYDSAGRIIDYKLPRNTDFQNF